MEGGGSRDLQVEARVRDLLLKLDDLFGKPVRALGAVLLRGVLVAIVIVTPRRPGPWRPDPEAFLMDDQLMRFLIRDLSRQQCVILVVERHQQALQGALVQVDDGLFLIVFLTSTWRSAYLPKILITPLPSLVDRDWAG